MNRLPTPDDIELAAASAGLRIAEICSRADVSQATWYRWRKGESDIKVTTLQRLIDAIATENRAVSGKDAQA